VFCGDAAIADRVEGQLLRGVRLAGREVDLVEGEPEPEPAAERMRAIDLDTADLVVAGEATAVLHDRGDAA
jgi:hypothetical protein